MMMTVLIGWIDPNVPSVTVVQATSRIPGESSKQSASAQGEPASSNEVATRFVTLCQYMSMLMPMRKNALGSSNHVMEGFTRSGKIAWCVEPWLGSINDLTDVFANQQNWRTVLRYLDCSAYYQSPCHVQDLLHSQDYIRHATIPLKIYIANEALAAAILTKVLINQSHKSRLWIGLAGS